jgi:hypothetical protein
VSVGILRGRVRCGVGCTDQDPRHCAQGRRSSFDVSRVKGWLKGGRSTVDEFMPAATSSPMSTCS